MEKENYHQTIYYSIIKNYGDSKLLTFMLRAYRFIIYRIKDKIN